MNNAAAQHHVLPLPIARVAPVEVNVRPGDNVNVRPGDNIAAFNVREEIVSLHKTQAKLDTSLKCFALISFLGFCVLQCFIVTIVTVGLGSVGAALYFRM